MFGWWFGWFGLFTFGFLFSRVWLVFSYFWFIFFGSVVFTWLFSCVWFVVWFGGLFALVVFCVTREMLLGLTQLVGTRYTLGSQGFPALNRLVATVFQQL